MEAFLSPQFLQFVSSVGLPGGICIITIFCVGWTNKELKTAIDALTSEIKISNTEQKNKIEQLENEVKEIKYTLNLYNSRRVIND